jgi:hypothetical protein
MCGPFECLPIVQPPKPSGQQGPPACLRLRGYERGHARTKHCNELRRARTTARSGRSAAHGVLEKNTHKIGPADRGQTCFAWSTHERVSMGHAPSSMRTRHFSSLAQPAAALTLSTADAVRPLGRQMARPAQISLQRWKPPPKAEERDMPVRPRRVAIPHAPYRADLAGNAVSRRARLVVHSLHSVGRFSLRLVGARTGMRCPARWRMASLEVAVDSMR